MKLLLIIFGLLFAFTAKSQEISERDLMAYISMNSGGMYETQVIQMGNQNTAVIDANSISVTQTGDLNQFYYTESSILPSDLNINIEGTNNYVEVFGNNQILDGLTITIQGDDRNVIINNY